MLPSNIDGPSSSSMGRLRGGWMQNQATQGRWVATTRFLWSYLPDWISVLFFASLTHQLGKVSGFKREFSLSDTSIQHTYTPTDRVPRWTLHMISSLAPAILMLAINLISIQSLWDLHNSWLGLTLSLTLTGLISNLVKVCVGRPRPDLISRCVPSPDARDKPVWGLSNHTICTQTDERILRDGFRSFPSGHASLSFAGLGFLTFYLAGKLRLWDKNGQTVKVWVTLVPLMGAGLVAISRTMDYRHHWHDIFVGSLLGVTLAFISYHQFFHPLTHPNCHLPLPPRVDLSTNRIRDHRREAREEMEPLVRPDDDVGV